MNVTNNSSLGLILHGALFEDDTLTATGAITLAAGTLLGRITASGKLREYTSGAVDGSQVPVTVLPHEVVFTAAGDKPIRPIIAGRLRRGKLVAHGVGAITQAEADALRNYGIIAQATTQLAEQDNQ